MNTIHVIGIGFRPLEKRAVDVMKESDVILSNEGLLESFRYYQEYSGLKKKLILIKNAHETIGYIRDNCEKEVISVLAAGDPMFFGIGRMIVNEFGKAPVEIYPDLSSIQVAFARIKESWSEAYLISLHGGPDPDKRRKPEYELGDLARLLELHDKIGILTDSVNNPTEISKALDTLAFTRHLPLKMYVCERLGLPDERITEGTPEEISKRSFFRPNVVLILK